MDSPNQPENKQNSQNNEITEGTDNEIKEDTDDEITEDTDDDVPLTIPQLQEKNKRLNEQVIDYRMMNLENCQQRMYIMNELTSIKFTNQTDCDAVTKIFLKLVEFSNKHRL